MKFGLQLISTSLHLEEKNLTNLLIGLSIEQDYKVYKLQVCEIIFYFTDDSLTTEGDDDFQIPQLVLPTTDFKNPEHSGSQSNV